MKPRDRVLAAVEHRPVDRVPIDFGGHRSSGIMAIVYARLKEHLGVATGDTHRVLPGGSAEDVAAHVRQQGAVMARGSGFVFQQVHNVMADVPPANVVSMFRAASQLRTG
jgi:uroporphyrinogen-III decarboxylase